MIFLIGSCRINCCHVDEYDIGGLGYLDLSINSCGHGYGSGADMVGVNSGVKTRTVAISTGALSASCGSHSWNLLLGGTAKSAMASRYFS
jgi:hypothetical protein